MPVKREIPVDRCSGQGYDNYRRRIKLVIRKSTESFKEVRCADCNALFFKATSITGTIEMKCRKCGRVSSMIFD